MRKPRGGGLVGVDPGGAAPTSGGASAGAASTACTAEGGATPSSAEAGVPPTPGAATKSPSTHAAPSADLRAGRPVMPVLYRGSRAAQSPSAVADDRRIPSSSAFREAPRASLTSSGRGPYSWGDFGLRLPIRELGCRSLTRFAT